MKRRRLGHGKAVRAFIVSAALAVAAIALPAAARANTYTVSACNNGVNHAWAQYWSSGTTNVTSGAHCPGQYAPGNPGITYNSGLFVRNVSNTSYTPAGQYGGISLTAPAGNTLASISGDWWVTRGVGTGFYAVMMNDWSVVAGCGSDPGLCGAYLGGQVVPLSGASQVRVEVGCHNPAPGCNAANANQAIFELYRTDVVINDNTAPSVSPSGTLWTGNWISGAKTVTLAAGDGADGIQRTDLNIDGKNVASQSHGCDYTYVTPCPTSVGDSFTFDTHQLSDGAHAIQAATYDAAWLGGAANGTIQVDNHAPDMSSTAVTVAQGTDWTPDNGFDLSWTNPTGQAAPIVKAHYSLCDAADPSDCAVTNGVVAANGVHAMSGIHVPSPGNYVVRVWLEDAAGNVNSGLASLPVHLRYDPTVPGLAQPAHRNGWVNADEADAYPQPIAMTWGADVGPSGIKGYSITTDGSTPDETVEAYGTKPSFTINDLPEGRNIVKARAVSGAGVASDEIGQTEVDVDESKPEASVSGNPDPGQWQRGAVSLTITGVDQPDLSGMQGYRPDLDQKITDGGYLEYRLDGLAPTDIPGRNSAGVDTESAPLRVDGDGAHTVTYKAVDFAGNESAEKTVQFKIDQTAPELVAFEAQDPAHPATMSVAVLDRTSGVAGGIIELRREGAAAWTDLPTQLVGDHLVAHVDDAGLTPGAYEFQAKVRDVAGNEAVSNRRRDGGVEVLTAPFRFNTQMEAGIVNPKAKARLPKVSAKCRRSKKCLAKMRKRRAAVKRRASRKLPAGTRPTLTIAYGKSALIKGRLHSNDGAPIASQPVDVYQQLDASGQKMGRVATVRTNASGQFDYHAPKGPSRTIRFQFDGNETLHPAAAEVKLIVPASSTLRVNRHHVRNGKSVHFSGRIGRPVVAGLKVIDLQAFYRHKWRTFATPRTTKTGAWKYTYRFEATSGVVTYKFRARIRREASYPYKLGYSKVVKVTVNG